MNPQKILITGATDGVGKCTAIDLAMQNTYLLLHGRNKEKLDKVITEIKSSTGNQNIEGFVADFSSMDNVRHLAKNVLTKHDKINILINNAGAGFAASRYGKDRTELRLAVNYLAPFLLTNLLLPAIKKGVPSRIVNVSSSQGSLTLATDTSNKYYNHKGAVYQPSKSALNMYTIILAYELKDTAVKVNAIDPGFIKTDFNNHRGTGTVEEAGARILKYVLIENNGPTGKFFSEEYNPATGEIPW